jgi:AcrR family transcriptional regulator
MTLEYTENVELKVAEPVKTAPVGSAHDRILRVSKTLFANRGYEHTSTSAIARLAGTSESQLMKHFGNKSGLLEAIFTDGWNQITEQARLASESFTEPTDKLQAISTTALRHLERDQELKLLYLLEGRRIRKEGQMVALTEGFLGFVRLIDSVLTDMHENGRLRAGVSPQAVRSALMGMLEGMLRDRFLCDRLGFPANFDLKQLAHMLTLALGCFCLPAKESLTAVPAVGA